MALTKSQNPPEVSLSFGEIQGPWCVVVTRPRAEKALAGFLLERGIDYLLPLSLERSRYPVPLFPGILFLAVNKCRTDYYQLPPDTPPEQAHVWQFHRVASIAKSSSYVLSFMHTIDQERFRKELALIASETYEDRTLRIEKALPLKAGRTVEVIEGGFQGLRGIFKKYKSGMTRIYVDLNTLGTLVSMELDANQVRAVKE